MRGNAFNGSPARITKDAFTNTQAPIRIIRSLDEKAPKSGKGL
jgi:hypothetical protein